MEVCKCIRKALRDYVKKLGTWNCKTLSSDVKTRIAFDEVWARGFEIVALQEVCWKGVTVRQYRSNCTIYQSGGETRELGTAFMVLGAMQQRVIGWWPINERMCRLRIRGRFFNLSIINVHSPHIGSTYDEKEAFYTQLEREYDRCPKHDVKVVIGDLNAQVGQEEAYKPTIGSFSVHQLTNDNSLRLINYASSKHIGIRSTFSQHAHRHSYTWRHPKGVSKSQIRHFLIDGRHFSDIIDVNTYRGANVDSDHFLVMARLRQKLSVVNYQQSQATPRLNLDLLKCADVAEGYATALGEALPADNNIAAMPLADHWRMVERAISTAAEHKIGSLPLREKKEWFDEECRRALSEKNAARARMLWHETRNLLTDEREVIERWKYYYEGHLNGAEAGEAGASGRTRQPPQQHSSNNSDSIGADDKVPPASLDEIASAIKQLESNKSAESDGLVA
ncbi:uncharacterized protein LOC121598784 [Anopheles merus]|uniref:uncharacterized protein LOC121598784 n=1 Tax=Anopheles merus TaxID=30066 RepID=UPI001BE4A73C|nr:uncharacterized protein LOC121598784 [Anopheles merus]